MPLDFSLIEGAVELNSREGRYRGYDFFKLIRFFTRRIYTIIYVFRARSKIIRLKIHRHRLTLILLPHKLFSVERKNKG